MKRIHLLGVDEPPEAFAALLEAARARGRRIGWLELDEVPAPERLARAADLGALRAVAAGGRRTVTVKTRAATAVLRDLLRESFQGCCAVLVTGDPELPRLRPAAPDWIVVLPEGVSRRFQTEELLAAFDRPRPFARRPTA